MSQIYNENTESLKLGILGIYALLEIKQRASGPGESCWGYVSLGIHPKFAASLP